MIFPVVINGTLALLWGYMYYVTGNPWILFSSGIATGGALTLGTMTVCEYRNRHRL
jgi:hypothetical protein